ncbi:uncharacterized protein LOC115373647 [Myripristis murdjan]|uniref:uncharacterized protein LOC115373647 n=1 Tax=Myripristis murdjan TaxID=586833 RepID=UPI0011760A9B|nr:uncharacterized protein LOC115373647 [Myripristis murdjan]
MIVKYNKGHRDQVSVQISPQHSLPSVNHSQSLVCQGATTGLPVVWNKNGQEVRPRVGISLQEYNTTLHFDSLVPSDAGFYQCTATVPTLEKTTVYSRGYLLSFDPWNVSISGPDSIFERRETTFTCLTSCTVNVDCTVSWQFRSGFPTGLYLSINRNVLKWTPSIPGTFQNITCVAENKAAGRTAEATKMVKVVGYVLSGSETMQRSGLFSVILGLGLFLLNS